MSSTVVVLIWFAIALAGFTAGLAGIVTTKRRLAGGQPGAGARDRADARWTAPATIS